MIIYNIVIYMRIYVYIVYIYNSNIQIYTHIAYRAYNYIYTIV